MEDKKIVIIYKEVGKEPVPMKIENSLKEKERLVGGKLKVMGFEDIYVCCNEEFQKKTIRPNITYKFGSICGDFFVTNKEKESNELKSLTKEQAIEYYLYLKRNGISYDNCDENGKILTRFERRRKKQQEKFKAMQEQKSKNNSFKINENPKIELKNNETNNLPKNVEKEGKRILEANDSSSKIEESNKEILKMILGIQAMILQYVNGKIDSENTEESEE